MTRRRFALDEKERPVEFLRALEEQPQHYALILDEAGSLAIAAHRIATARCRVSAISSAIPTALELGAAAFEIAARIGWDGPLPTTIALAQECEHAGLLVIRPVVTRVAA